MDLAWPLTGGIKPANLMASLARKSAGSPGLEGDSQPEDEVQGLRPASPEALFHQAYQGIVRSLALAAGDLASAEDATQEAFVEACVRWNSISRYDNPAAWVRRVAINKLRKRYRSNVRAAAAVLRLVADEQVVPSPVEPDTGLVAALRLLPPRQRLAVVLYYVDDLTIAEVASAMGISQGSVSQHLNRGRTALRAYMEASQ